MKLCSNLIVVLIAICPSCSHTKHGQQVILSYTQSCFDNCLGSYLVITPIDLSIRVWSYQIGGDKLSKPAKVMFHFCLSGFRGEKNTVKFNCKTKPSLIVSIPMGSSEKPSGRGFFSDNTNLHSCFLSFPNQTVVAALIIIQKIKPTVKFCNM